MVLNYEAYVGFIRPDQFDNATVLQPIQLGYTIVLHMKENV